jgi:hydroxymethylpyrimidine pyrophosphatase-like HAD family hydrolase
LKRPLITGGDDNNDIPLLKVGDIRIAMDGAPELLQNLAHIIAPPADRMGIITALEEAIDL